MLRNTALLFTLIVTMLIGFSGGAFAGDAAAGKPIYDANCSACHGVSGTGDGPVGAALVPPPRDFTTADFKYDTDGDGSPGSDADLKNVIQKGALAFGGSPLMAPWPTLNETQIGDIIAHIRSLKK
jgi:mono/diheme cytochrome c family protein